MHQRLSFVLLALVLAATVPYPEAASAFPTGSWRPACVPAAQQSSADGSRCGPSLHAVSFDRLNAVGNELLAEYPAVPKEGLDDLVAALEAYVCARNSPCSPDACIQSYLALFPNGAHLTRMDRIRAGAQQACRSSSEEQQKFNQVLDCIAGLRNACETAICAKPYLELYNGSETARGVLEKLTIYSNRCN